MKSKARTSAKSSGQSTTKAGAQIIVDTLVELGVDTMFGYTGGVVLPLFDRLYDAPINFIVPRHEQGGCHMADAYARASGKVGVVVATSGPGACNLVTGLATAHMVANCLPSFPECHHLMHGEEVGFGVITQLCLDKAVSMDEVYEAVDFEVAVGLPVTFEELGLNDPSRERLKTIGDVCAGEGSLCASHCFEVTSEAVVDAMIAADALGAERKALAGV